MPFGALVSACRGRKVPDLGLVYLLKDQFTTAESAPLASPRTCEPGPGTATIVDTGNKLSVSSGRLQCAGMTVSQSDPTYHGPAFARAAGRALLATVNFSGTFTVGWDNSNTGGIDRLAWIVSATPPYARVNGTAITLPNISFNTDYEFATILRGTAGAFFCVRGGAIANWALLWVDNAVTDATMYPGCGIYTNDNTAQVDDFRVLDLPLFATDPYTQRVSGAVSAGQSFTHTANFLAYWVCTTRPSAGNQDVVVREQDASNRWTVRVNSSGDISLRETVGGSTFSRGSSAGVVSNGHRVGVVADGTTIRVYSNNTLRITYASASTAQTATAGQVADLGTSGALSDLETYPRDVSALIPAGA